MVMSLSVCGCGVCGSGGNWPSRLPSMTLLMMFMVVSEVPAVSWEPVVVRRSVMRWNSAVMLCVVCTVEAVVVLMSAGAGDDNDASVRPGGVGGGGSDVMGARVTPAPNNRGVECNGLPEPCNHVKLLSLTACCDCCCCWFDVRVLCMANQPCMSACVVVLVAAAGEVLGCATMPKSVLNGGDDDDGDDGTCDVSAWVDGGTAGDVVGM